jgi:predicted RNA-binding Zn ribbon-like protein
VSNGAELIKFREGAGRLCLDFLRTLRFAGSDHAVEELAGPAELAAWITWFSSDRAAPPIPPNDAQVREARLLREAIRSVLASARSISDPAPDLRRERGRINAAAARPPGAPRLDSSNTVHWDTGAGITTLMSLIARDAIDLVSSAQLPRVRNCANPECGALFLDSSRPGTRRWCSMNRCGNLAKKSAWRNKAVAATTDGGPGRDVS